MKMRNMYEAGVGLAHEANNSRALIQEYEAAKTSLSISESEKAEQRARTLGTLGLDARPEDFNDCDSTDLYMNAGLLQAEQARYDILMGKADLLINGATQVEQETVPKIAA
jgi:hypothetical protein